MAFIIKKRESYRWTVEHLLEMRDGKPDAMVFDAEFKALPQTRIEQLLKLARETKINDQEFLAEILVNWHGLKEESGEVFPCNSENVKQLLEMYPGMAASFSRAWTDSVLGGGAARKN